MDENQFFINPSSEASLNSFRSEGDLWKDLVGLGFDANMIEAVLYFYYVKDLNTAIMLLMKSDEGYFHIYIPNENNPEVCLVCKEGLDQHNPRPIDVSQLLSYELSHLNSIENIDVSKIQIEVDSAVHEVRCEICYMEYRTDSIITLPCEHMFCPACTKEYLSLEIREGRVLEIRCCQSGCEFVFEVSIIQSLVDSLIFEKYLIFKRNKQVELDPESRWCPNNKCGQIIKIQNKTTNYLQCNCCKTEICFECKELWHPGLNCEIASERTYELWAKGKDIQRCGKCKARVEKDLGCNHMTCTVCGYQWCWLCRAKYTSTHFDRLNVFGCPGLRSGDNTAKGWKLHRRLAKKLGIVLLMMIISPLSNVHIVLVFWFAALSTYEMYAKYEGNGTCMKYFVYILGFIGGLILTPLAYVVLIITIPIGSVRYCVNYLKEQRNN